MNAKQQQVEKDAARMEAAAKTYSGANGAHFGFIATATGERHFIAGGRADILGMCLGEGIAQLIRITPGIQNNPNEFINAVADTAREFVKLHREGKPQ